MNLEERTGDKSLEGEITLPRLFYVLIKEIFLYPTKSSYIDIYTEKVMRK